MAPEPEMPHSAASAPERRASWPVRIAQAAAVAVAYIGAAKVGFTAAFIAEQVSPVWPPAGLALWAGLYFGRQIWPAIWLGAFVANLTTSVPILVAAAVATGNTLEAIAGVWLLHRFSDIDRTLDGLRHVTTLLIGAALLSTTISATLGVSTLCVAGLQPWSRFGLLWWTWWLGDATGDLLVAPVLLTAPLWIRGKYSAVRLIEGVALATTTIATCLFVFAIPFFPIVANHPLEFVVFPFVIWAGLRFAHPGAAWVSAIVSVIAVWGTLHDSGPFSGTAVSGLHESVILLQIYTAVIATSGLAFGAAIADRNRAERLRITDHALTAILSGENDLKGATPRLLQAVCDTLEWDVGIVWTTAEDRQVLDYVDSWQRDARFDAFVTHSRTRSFQPGVGLPGRVWACAQPIWIYDVVIDPYFPRAAVAAQCGLHGGFAFPILLGRRVVGVMEFFTRQPRKVDAQLLTLMAAAGSQIGQFIDRRDAQNRVYDSEALNAAIVHAALDCVISIDDAGRILEFNPAATRTFGVSRDQALGKELAEVVVPARLRDRHREALRKCVETGEGRILGNRVEMSALRADGTEFPVELSINRVGVHGRPVFTAYLRDISERKRVEEERAELLVREHAARVQAENANRSKDQFLTTVSHELRTPLTAILGWASMLRSRPFDEKHLARIHESIYRNAEVQAQIVNDLLDVSRMITGQLRLELQPINVCDMARLSLDTIRPTVIAKRVRLESQIPSAPLMVSGDPARLQQVIWNLLSNAAKFTPEGGTVSLVVRESKAKGVAIEVTDSGIGIAPALLPHVFERFWQADSSTTRVHGGLGLGLSIVRHIVELHGGDVEARSAGEGCGSRFTVVLPARIHDAPDGAPAQDSRAGSSETSRSGERPAALDLQGLTALVVDDDPAARELFATVLEGHGARVLCAESASEAFDLYECQKMDVMVIDIGMPGENGLMLLTRIRALDSGSTPAIAVTAYAGVMEREAALNAGFAAHVPKPVLPDDLVAAVLGAIKSGASA